MAFGRKQRNAKDMFSREDGRDGSGCIPYSQAFFTRRLLLQWRRSPSIALLSSAVMALSHADNPWLGVTDEHGVLQDEPMEQHCSLG